MRSKAKTYRLPSALEEAAEQRYKEAGYASMSEWIIGLVRYDLLTRKPHEATANISKMSRVDQDRADAETAKMFKSGETLAGSWFQHKIEDAVAAAGKDAPERHKIIVEILKRLGGK